MKTLFLSILTVCLAISSQAQNLYFKTFGKQSDEAIIFLHGGPGYNCANFEATTAQALADKGFYVIVYDRRGEGRSDDKAAQFTFAEAMKDLNGIYRYHNIIKASLIAHSFGGMLACKFALAQPEKVKAVAFVGAPLEMQSTFKQIIKVCKAIYQEQKDSTNLKYIAMLEGMDTANYMYASYCFMHALQNNFYMPSPISKEAKQLYMNMMAGDLAKVVTKQDYLAPVKWHKNEAYTTLNLSGSYKTLKDKKIKIINIVGKQDGLITPSHITQMKEHSDKFYHWDGCSHNAFIDQQEKFLKVMVSLKD